MLIFFLVSLLWCYFQNGSWSSDYEDNGFEIASDLLNNGLYPEAIGAYQNIVDNSKHAGDRARALLFIANTYRLYLNQYDSALNLYQRVIRQYPNALAAEDALYNTGVVLYEQGKFDGAHSIFLKFIKRFPLSMRKKSAELWGNSAALLAGTGPALHKPSDRLNPVDTQIRVLVKENAKSIRIAGSTITVSDLLSGHVLFSGGGPFVFTQADNHLAVNGRAAGVSGCRIQSADGMLQLDASRFRGYVTISAGGDGLSVINHVPLEQYLYGVIPKEMSCDWESEALKAQTVASRTYALYVKSKSFQKAYDVTATTASQVYGGLDAESPATNAAVDATRGQVLIHEGELIIACFHADSGGYTEDAEKVWTVEFPYLKGVPDTYSCSTDDSQWQYFITYADLSRKLSAYGLEAGRRVRIIPGERSASGRVITVKIITDDRRMEFTGNNFRIMAGPTKLRSTLFEMLPSEKGILFMGRGYGHGVGMSQWGAEQMARAGFSYPNILKHYYQNVRLVNICR